MQRIKLEVFKTFFHKNLTGNEIDFIIALSHLQNDKGVVYGVHYKEIIERTNISIQAFYDCKQSLQDKGIIEVMKVHNDYDITLIGNDFTMFTNEDYKLGKVKYISTNQKIFYDQNWDKLKPAQKLLVMDLLNINTASNFRTYRIHKNKFIEKYTGLLHIGKRTLITYLKMLKLYFYVGQKDGMYLITLRKYFGAKHVKSEHDVSFRYLIKAACRRNLIKEPDQREFNDILITLEAYRKPLMETHGFIYLPDIFTKMIEVINDGIHNRQKWKRRLKASLFHKLIKVEMGI